MSKLSDRLDKSELSLQMVNISVENQAQKILAKNPLYYDDNKKWWGFNKDKLKWVEVDEVDIISFIKKTYELQNLSSSSIRSQMLNALKDEARLKKPKKSSTNEIQIGKWIYNIKTKKRIMASENIFCQIVIDREIEKHLLVITEKNEYAQK